MALIEVCVQVWVEPGRCTPEVRLWLDLLPAHGLGSEIELPLTQRDANTWVGAFAVREDGAGSFIYRVGVAAHAGASWALSFRDRARKRDLLVDCDLLGCSKAWLTGDCFVQSASRRNAARSLT